MSERALDPYVSVARAAIESYVRKGSIISPSESVPEAMRSRAGVFVSLKKHGQLRGCIGTYYPTEESIAREIIANAIKAATRDPRFPPVGEEELSSLEISVDILSEPEPCGIDDLDPRRYGLIVESGFRRGLLLPDLPSVETTSQQLAIAKMKAGMAEQEPATLYRFTVERHTQTDES